MFNSQIADFYSKVTQQTVNYRKTNNITRSDFLQLFMQLHDEGQGLTMNQVTANAFLFVIAGYETTAATISHCLFEIARNEEIQRKVQAEIDEILGGNFNYEKVNDLKYLENCVTETLRKYPVVPILNRVCKHDYEVKGTSYVIPAGTSIIIPIYSMQRDIDDPMTFNPTRSCSNSLIAPFGIGQRACVGARMATFVIKLTISKILAKYNIQLVHPIASELTFSPKVVSLTPNEQILIQFTHRWKSRRKIDSRSSEKALDDDNHSISSKLSAILPFCSFIGVYLAWVWVGEIQLGS